MGALKVEQVESKTLWSLENMSYVYKFIKVSEKDTDRHIWSFLPWLYDLLS